MPAMLAMLLNSPLHDVERVKMLVKKYPAKQNPKPEIMIIECVDVRFAEAFVQFTNDLGIDRNENVLMRIAGGLAPLAHPEKCPDRSRGLKNLLKFKCDKFKSIKKFLILTHSDCAYYEVMPECVRHYHTNSNGDKEEKEKRDSSLIGGFLELTFPDYEIWLRHAKFVDDKRNIVFEPVQPAFVRPTDAPSMEHWVKERQTVATP